MHSNPDKSGYDYAADYSFRYLKALKEKLPDVSVILIRVFEPSCFRDEKLTNFFHQLGHSLPQFFCIIFAAAVRGTDT